ncbi:MAG: hypothetical protein PHC28_13155 [Flavobacterium sp.]|uniref:hypothetical protein n=1 Tax=Flavobacterium sp. TaxID=239 RepID=UPI002632567A|nr:hypothetical protein [Flavobacterium sp.]MDD5151399.1 hypothetical protein [Flavobacterium sp.]
MDFIEFENRLNELIKIGEIGEAIQIAEDELNKIPSTSFHKIINRNLLHLTKELNDYINDFYKISKNHLEGNGKGFLNSLFSKKEDTGKTLKAIYCEMNGFTINYDLWFISLQGFSSCNDLDDIEWLGDSEYDYERYLTISGFEDLQSVYKDYMNNERWDEENLETACELCAILITLRLEELFKELYTKSISKNIPWTEIPLFVTSHDSELIYRTKL